MFLKCSFIALCCIGYRSCGLKVVAAFEPKNFQPSSNLVARTHFPKLQISHPFYLLLCVRPSLYVVVCLPLVVSFCVGFFCNFLFCIVRLANCFFCFSFLYSHFLSLNQIQVTTRYGFFIVE